MNAAIRAAKLNDIGKIAHCCASEMKLKKITCILYSNSLYRASSCQLASELLLVIWLTLFSVVLKKCNTQQQSDVLYTHKNNRTRKYENSHKVVHITLHFSMQHQIECILIHDCKWLVVVAAVISFKLSRDKYTVSNECFVWPIAIFFNYCYQNVMSN